MSDIISDIYSGGITEVAAFAPIAFEAYEKGDSSAAEILDKNAFEIALIIRTCCDDLDENDRKIVLCGGLCNQKEILGPLISKHLGDGYDVEFLHEPMVSGAVSLAMKNGGKSC